MQYVNLGNTNLKVSRIAFGNWLNSDSKNNMEQMTKLVQKAWDLGINYFETAEEYGAGEGERQFAVALKNLNISRERYVLSTKLFWGPNCSSNPNELGLSRKHILEGMRGSLQRLEHDYVDIVFAHRFDCETPLEETCRAFDQLIKDGLALYWGTSEWSASQIFEAFMICAQYNLTFPIADQCEYNMFNRQKVEVDYGRLFDKYKYGTTVYSPLAGGILSGKYNTGIIPEDSRFNIYASELDEERFDMIKNMQQKLQDLEKIAQEIGCTQAQLAYAWVLKSNDVSCAIFGASKIEQLDSNLKTLEILDKLNPEILQKIEEILKNKPKQERNNLTWQPMKDRR